MRPLDPFLAELLDANPSHARRIAWNVLLLDGPPKPGLKANGLDDSWCHKRRSEMTLQERELRLQSDQLRHQLHLERATKNRAENEARAEANRRCDPIVVQGLGDAFD